MQLPVAVREAAVMEASDVFTALIPKPEVRPCSADDQQHWQMHYLTRVCR